MRYKDENGAFFNEDDQKWQNIIIDEFDSVKVDKDKYTVVKTLDIFNHADAEVVRVKDASKVAFIEAKFRNTDQTNATHGLQVGLDKVVGIWNKHCPGWMKDQMLCKPIIVLAGFHTVHGDKTSPVRIVGINLGHIHPWLYKKAKTHAQLDGDNNYEDYRRHKDGADNWQLFRPRISWTTNTDQYPPKQHWCIWVPLEWCADVKPNFQLGEGIRRQRYEDRISYASSAFHFQEDPTE